MSQGGIAGADRVVLVGDRRAEQGHDAVAHDLVDGALVAVDGLHHPLEDRIEQLARLFGVTVGQQFHRALEVGEENGHLLPLALERRLRREDLLGEVLGRVGLRGREPRFGGAYGGKRGSTPAAEVLARLVRGPAGWAHRGQGRRTLRAESRPSRFSALAPRTRHGRGGSPPP